jgi:hypothetical protein
MEMLVSNTDSTGEAMILMNVRDSKHKLQQRLTEAATSQSTPLVDEVWLKADELVREVESELFT